MKSSFSLSLFFNLRCLFWHIFCSFLCVSFSVNPPLTPHLAPQPLMQSAHPLCIVAWCARVWWLAGVSAAADSETSSSVPPGPPYSPLYTQSRLMGQFSEVHPGFKTQFTQSSDERRWREGELEPLSWKIQNGDSKTELWKQSRGRNMRGVDLSQQRRDANKEPCNWKTITVYVGK